MNDDEIETALTAVNKARSAWDTARAKFESDVQYMMSRLINEAVAQYMSAEDIARYSGFTTKRVRLFMRIQRLDPTRGKRTLAKTAADTLRTNALIMGVEPKDMDLTSPLAYLPMGKKMREEFLETEAVRQGVHEMPVATCNVPGCNCDVDYRAEGQPDDYDAAKARIETALSMGRDVEGLPISYSNIPEIAAWLASEGIK